LEEGLLVQVWIRYNCNLQPFKVYEKWCNNYKFHVLITIRLLYGMMQYQFAMRTFVAAVSNSLQGKPNRLERGFIAWTLGDFDRHHKSLYCMWAVFLALITISKIRQIIWREKPWSSGSQLRQLGQLGQLKTINLLLLVLLLITYYSLLILEYY
jgi:hypothetical protein